MNRFRIFLLSMALVACSAITVADDAVRAVSVDTIRDNPAVLEGVTIVSTGQPDQAVLEAARDAGFVAVIDLRTDGEDRGMDETAVVAAAGMEYVSIPVAGASGITFENAKLLDEALAGIDGPVFLHCRSGNRVGALMALRASAAGASDEDAIAVGKAAGLGSLEAAVVEQLDAN
jgi:uncharacterized protein (TIGR01244 family)